MESLILPEEIQRALDIAIWTPMRPFAEYIKQHGNLKRSLLAAGGYGTGKTLSMSNTAKLGKDLGFTVVYCKKTHEFDQALRVARNYQNPVAVLIVEDIDIELSAGRTDNLNQIINTLDGLETKNDNIITLTTTNDLEALEPAAIRQGRMSAKILFTNPDAAACIKLLHVYGKGLISDKEDLSVASKLMDGMNPAEVQEIITIAKLAHMRETGQSATSLTAHDIEEAARYMQTQADIQRKIEKIHEAEVEPTIDSVITSILDRKQENYEPKLRKIVNEESEH